MSSRPRCLSALLVCLPLLTGSFALLGGGPAAAAAPVEDPVRGLHYKGLQPGRDDGPCKGKFEVHGPAGRGGPTRCTHGPDPAPPGVDVRVAREPETQSETAALRPDTVTQAEGTVCAGDGTSGNRVQMIYAYVSGNADRYATFASSFLTWAAAMDSVFEASANETGGSRRLRFVHDGACKPTVLKAVLSGTAGADFNATIDELWNKGFSRNDRKYVVWMDANVYCGIGEVYNDDRAGQNNNNNVFGMFARVDNGCWGMAGQSVEAHELMHNLGGVQTSAPHATTYNHCTDERDRMCYADGSGAPLTQVCPTSHENVFDCNHDDYFNTAPPTGSYLATHWNVANSAWLIASPASTVPSPPGGVSAVPGEGTATLSWSPPTADGGLPVSGYVVTPYAGATAQAAQTFSSTATTQTVAGLTNETAYTFKVAAINPVGTGPESPASSPVTPSVGARFNPVTPARILDTRFGDGAPAAKIGPGGSIDLLVTGRGGLPASGVSAVVLNIAVTEPAAAGFLTAFPTGEALPLAANLTFVAGQTVPNLVAVKVGAGGKITLYNGGTGGIHVVADVGGWYGAGGATAGSRYHPLAPSRVLDTRTGLGFLLPTLLPGGSLDLQIAGAGGVPSTGVTAVALNVAVTEPMAPGFLTAWPTGSALPLASSLNFDAAQTVANLVVAKVSSDGRLSFYNGSSGTVHVIADVAGWFGPGGEVTGAAYHPVTPARVLDTRNATGAPAAPLAYGGVLDLQVTGRGGLPATGVTAVILNLVVVSPTAPGYLTAWPTGQSRPLASSLNFAAGKTVPNLVVVKVGTGGKISVYNGGGSAHLVADIAGWYGSG